jgi:hypothetical protein
LIEVPLIDVRLRDEVIEDRFKEEEEEGTGNANSPLSSFSARG